MVELLKSELDRKIGNNYIFKAVQFGYNINKKGNGSSTDNYLPFHSKGISRRFKTLSLSR